MGTPKIMLILTDHFRRDAVGPSTPNLRRLAGVAGYEAASSELCQGLLAHRIRLTQYTHHKEERRLQRVRVTD